MADFLYISLVQRDIESIKKANDQANNLANQGDFGDGDQTLMNNTADALYDGYDDIDVDELKEEMEKIRVLCIASHIMEMTRQLSEDDKRVLQRYCDEI